MAPHAQQGRPRAARARRGDGDGRQQTATDTPCPAESHPFVYPDHPGFEATCEGTPQRNGFYGHGIVDAQRILINHERSGR